MIAPTANMEDQNIKDAQYRKSLSISFFNATNNAAEIVKIMQTMTGEKMTYLEMQQQIIFWRDWLLEQHRDYYATTIASVGGVYKVEDTVKRLKGAQSMEELKQKWLNLSQDERRDPEIIDTIKKMKVELAKPKKVEPKSEVKKVATKTNEKPRQHKARVPRVAPNKKG